MDVIALLCNMHAEGPATVRVLRRAGLSTLRQIEAERTERLAELLGSSPVAARRFAREARLLAHRTGDPATRAHAPRDAKARAREGVRARTPTPVERELATRELSQRDLAAPSRAAPAAWAAAVVAPIETPRPAGKALRPAAPEGEALRRGVPKGQALRPGLPEGQALRPGLPEGQALRPGLVDGLDALWCEKLVAQGILTLTAFADAPGLALARRVGLPYARLLDMQCLAQRRLTDAARIEAVSTEAPCTERSSEFDSDYELPRPTTVPAHGAFAVPLLGPADSSGACGAPEWPEPPDSHEFEAGGPFA